MVIETFYAGYHFRSRLEARWAVFLNHLHVPFQYEMEGFEWPGIGRYLPDFYLPTISCRGTKPGVWLEIAPPDYRATEYDEKRYFQLVLETKKTLILTRGLPPVGDNYCTNYTTEYTTYADEPMLFIRCSKCGAMRFEFSESNYMYCKHCPADGFHSATDNEPELLEALDAAKQARFGVYERSRPETKLFY